MAVVFRVGFEGESRCIDALAEGRYEVRAEDEGVVHLLDDVEDEPGPKTADTFDRALALIAGWEQGVPLLVDPAFSENISAALVTHQGRTSSGWQDWLRTGRVRGR